MSESDGQGLSELSTSELSKLDWLFLAWGFWWRGYLLFGVSYGFSRGFLVGLSFGSPGSLVPREMLLIVLTMLLVVLYLRWLLKASFRGFRLALVRCKATGPRGD